MISSPPVRPEVCMCVVIQFSTSSSKEAFGEGEGTEPPALAAAGSRYRLGIFPVQAAATQLVSGG